jgi:hypothetical protein
MRRESASPFKAGTAVGENVGHLDHTRLDPAR